MNLFIIDQLITFQTHFAIKSICYSVLNIVTNNIPLYGENLH